MFWACSSVLCKKSVSSGFSPMSKMLKPLLVGCPWLWASEYTMSSVVWYICYDYPPTSRKTPYAFIYAYACYLVHCSTISLTYSAWYLQPISTLNQKLIYLTCSLNVRARYLGSKRYGLDRFTGCKSRTANHSQPLYPEP